MGICCIIDVFSVGRTDDAWDRELRKSNFAMRRERRAESVRTGYRPA